MYLNCKYYLFFLPHFIKYLILRMLITFKNIIRETTRENIICAQKCMAIINIYYYASKAPPKEKSTLSYHPIFNYIICPYIVPFNKI